MRARELRGRTVLDVSTARELCRVEAVVLDPDSAPVVAFRVTGDSPVLPMRDVVAVGADAVTVEGADALHQPESLAESRAVQGGIDALDHLVLSEDGSELGRVVDVEIEPDGAVRTIVLEHQDLPGDRLLGIGDYALVVRSG